MLLLLGAEVPFLRSLWRAAHQFDDGPCELLGPHQYGGDIPVTVCGVLWVPLCCA